MELHTKYRPTTLDGVLGQDAVVASLRKVLDKGTSHAFIFTGPSGTGKTTLGRLIAMLVGCSPSNLLEVDAATHTGVDAMRDVTANLHLGALGKSKVKVIIIDEAQMLSKGAWNSLLKAVEEPPAHVYWVFCTTEPTKIPTTITTRCVSYVLNPVPVDDILGLLQSVDKSEGLDMDEDVLYLIAEKCEGSPRQALSFMSACSGCKNRKEAAAVMRTSSEDTDIIALCRHLMKGNLKWEGAMRLVEPLKDQNAEGHRLVICAYFSKVAMGATGDDAARRCLAVLSAFSEPYPTGSGMSPLLLSLGTLLLA